MVVCWTILKQRGGAVEICQTIAKQLPSLCPAIGSSPAAASNVAFGGQKRLTTKLTKWMDMSTRTDMGGLDAPP